MAQTKTVQSLTDLRNEQVGKVQEKGLRKLNQLFDSLWEEAQGVKFLVTPTNRKNQLPKNADKEAEGYLVDCICPKCKQPVLKEPVVLYEVWKERRDAMLLRYLYDQMVGRSSQKDKETTDPEIIIVFGDIDSNDNYNNSAVSSFTAKDAVDREINLGLPTLE